MTKHSNNNKLKVIEDAHLLYLTTYIYLVGGRNIHLEFKLHHDTALLVVFPLWIYEFL